MTYAVKEIFYTLQVEGANAGRPAVFCRFAGCNLWSGREQDRASAVCQFCDTDFVGTDGPGGGKFETAVDLAEAVKATWSNFSSVRGEQVAIGDAHRARGASGDPLVVCTGGEPLLQLDEEAVDALHVAGVEVAGESTGK